MGLELVIPGAFLLWIGLAGIIVGILASLITIEPEYQLIIFAVLAPVCSYMGKRFFKGLQDHAAAQLLSRRADSLIGQEFILEHSLSGGTSRMQVGDSSWTIKGPNLPAGTHVIVVAVDGNHLIVKKKEH